MWDAPEEQGGDRRRAREVAEQVRDVLREDPEQFADPLAEVEEWLDAHPG